MKILHIITGLNNGGAEGALYRLTRADSGSGNQHFVVSLMDRGIYGDRLEQAGISVTCLSMPRGHLTLRGLLFLYRYIRALKPDVVQTWLYHADLIGGIVARLAGTHAVVWGIRHSNVDRGQNKRSTFLVMKACAWLSAYVPSGIACCSEKAVPLHQKIGYRADKITVIPNGYALDLLKPDSTARAKARSELALEGKVPVLGMVARFDPEKDHHNLLSALKLLAQGRHKFTCLLIGSGMSPNNTALAKLISQTGVEPYVRLLGPRDDVPALMSALDVHILSSRSEAFPNVLAEAMACGTPCVSTDVGDASLILGSTGWLAPPHDPGQLAQAITTALNERGDHPQRWLTRQSDCRRHILEHFDIRQMVLAYGELWRSSLAAKAINGNTIRSA